MKCIICGNEIEDGEDRMLFGVDGDFMHKRCQSKWEKFMDRINNMSDAEFDNYLLGETIGAGRKVIGR